MMAGRPLWPLSLPRARMHVCPLTMTAMPMTMMHTRSISLAISSLFAPMSILHAIIQFDFFRWLTTAAAAMNYNFISNQLWKEILFAQHCAALCCAVPSGDRAKNKENRNKTASNRVLVVIYVGLLATNCTIWLQSFHPSIRGEFHLRDSASKQFLQHNLRKFFFSHLCFWGRERGSERKRKRASERSREP